MILDFPDITASELGEVLWDSFISARLVREPALREATPRPQWTNQSAETQALWNDHAKRLLALYGRKE